MRSSSVRLGFLGLVLLTASVLSTACEDDSVIGGKSFTFTGKITDSVTGEAIESAGIGYDSLTDGPFLSDSTGHYQGVTQSSRITIYARKAGYRTQSRSLYLTKDLTGVDFKLVQ